MHASTAGIRRSLTTDPKASIPAPTPSEMEDHAPLMSSTRGVNVSDTVVNKSSNTGFI